MPRKKIEEKDEELDVKKPVKKETFATRWFNEHAVNNAADLKIICDMTARSAYEQFKISVTSTNTEVFGVVFFGTFLTILDWIRQKQKTKNFFTIEIGKSVNLGYTNNTDIENEKVGNFMPVMEHIGINGTIANNPNTSNTDEDQTTHNCMLWKEMNLKKNVESYKEIQDVAFDRLKTDFRTDLRTAEAVIPLFCIFMDSIASRIRFKFQEAEGTDVSEVSMNVFGLFDIYYSFDSETNNEVIEFQPNIRMKLALKSDETSNRNM